MIATDLISPVPGIHSEIIQMHRSGASPDRLAARLADAGVEKIHAIRLLSDAAHLPLGEAKSIIHTSPAWAFRRPKDEQFHNNLASALGAEAASDLPSRRTGTR